MSTNEAKIRRQEALAAMIRQDAQKIWETEQVINQLRAAGMIVK